MADNFDQIQSDCEGQLVSIIQAQEYHLNLLFSKYSRRLGRMFKNFNGKITEEKRKQLKKLVRQMEIEAEALAREQVDRSVQLANYCADKQENAYLERIKDKLSKEQLENFFGERRRKASRAFAERAAKDQFNLSDRVWNLSQQTQEQLEVGLKSGIFNGRDPRKLARDFKQFLKEPNRRYRRVRNAEGKLVLSNPAKQYHPGQGVYRSSYKNALRLARTEVTMAYRKADSVRREQMDFVMGIRVRLSPAHPRYDICDELEGKYPKGFVFVGWHPQCICYTTSILYPEDKFLDHLNNGTPIDKRHQVKDIPKRAKQYIKDHAEQIKGWKNEPYFIRDNREWWDLERTFVPAKTIKEAEAYAKEQGFAKYVDFSKGSLEQANEINKTLQEIHRGEGLSWLRIAEMKDEHLHGTYNSLSKDIAINKDLPVKGVKAGYEKQDADLLRKYGSTWLAGKRNIREVLIHEYGHKTDFQNDLALMKGDKVPGQPKQIATKPKSAFQMILDDDPTFSKWVKETNEKFRESKDYEPFKYDVLQNRRRIIGKAVSQYALTNKKELFAELFTMYKTGQELPAYLRDVFLKAYNNAK